jgi:KAP family P-loop domain
MVPRSEPDNYRLLSDQPWRDAADPFGFEHLAARLKRLILDSRLTTPFTVGIEASWGAGKSSLMQQLERQLIGEESPSDREHWWPRFARPRPELEIRTVWFNAWTAAEADVQEGLVKSVLQALDRRILARALRKKKLITLLRAVVLTAAGFFKLTPLVNAAWESLSADARTRNEINDLISHAVSEWADPSNGLVRRRSTGLVVVFIDDLDRCSRANVTPGPRGGQALPQCSRTRFHHRLRPAADRSRGPVERE